MSDIKIYLQDPEKRETEPNPTEVGMIKVGGSNLDPNDLIVQVDSGEFEPLPLPESASVSISNMGIFCGI